MKLGSSLQNRKRAGIWLRGLREEAGLTQLELARRLHIKYYAFVSQVETGLSRVPTDKLEAWAHTLDVDPSDFAKRLISFYEPELHRLLYQPRSRRAHPSKKRPREYARHS
jgi:transcriptional regulator with XRE-family HTH domain